MRLLAACGLHQKPVFKRKWFPKIRPASKSMLVVSFQHDSIKKASYLMCVYVNYQGHEPRSPLVISVSRQIWVCLVLMGSDGRCAVIILVNEKTPKLCESLYYSGIICSPISILQLLHFWTTQQPQTLALRMRIPRFTLGLENFPHTL